MAGNTDRDVQCLQLVSGSPCSRAKEVSLRSSCSKTFAQHGGTVLRAVRRPMHVGTRNLHTPRVRCLLHLVEQRRGSPSGLGRVHQHVSTRASATAEALHRACTLLEETIDSTCASLSANKDKPSAQADACVTSACFDCEARGLAVPLLSCFGYCMFDAPAEHERRQAATLAQSL